MINPTNTPIKKKVMIPPLSFFILSPCLLSPQNPLNLGTTLNVEIHTNRKARIPFSFQRDKLNRRHQNI
jgi:hypothetical protein